MVVQAGAVLILEISCRFIHVSESGDSIIEDVGKVLMWLQAMSKTSHPSFRAWVALSRLLQLAVSSVDKNINQIDSVSTFLPDPKSLPDIGQTNRHRPAMYHSSASSDRGAVPKFTPSKMDMEQDQGQYQIQTPVAVVYDHWIPSGRYIASNILTPEDQAL